MCLWLINEMIDLASWLASSSIRVRILVNAKIIAGSTFKRFLWFVLIDVRFVSRTLKYVLSYSRGYAYFRLKTSDLEWREHAQEDWVAEVTSEILTLLTMKCKPTGVWDKSSYILNRNLQIRKVSAGLLGLLFLSAISAFLRSIGKFLPFHITTLAIRKQASFSFW
jgi:hypothetical protein